MDAHVNHRDQANKIGRAATAMTETERAAFDRLTGVAFTRAAPFLF
jgi:hypothetical protein